MDLTDNQWAIAQPLIPKPLKRADGHGRPRRDDRQIRNGILWIRRMGAPWKDRPEQYPSCQTRHRRFQEWVGAGVFERILQKLARNLKERGGLDLSQCCIDDHLASPERGLEGGKTKRGKGSKLMAVDDRAGLPIVICVGSAAPHEVTLVEPTREVRFLEERPERLIGDKASDSDSLDQRLTEPGVHRMAPHPEDRKKAATPDRCPWRSYKRRWKVERLFAWLQNFRQIAVRYERHVQNYLGLVQLGRIVILLRHYF